MGQTKRRKSLQQYREWLARVTYKHSITLKMDDDCVDFTVHGNDAWQNRRPDGAYNYYVFTGRASFRLPIGLAEPVFFHLLNEVILRWFEDHERCEWFKVDGVTYDDPHDPSQLVLSEDEIFYQAQRLSRALGFREPLQRKEVRWE